MDLSEHNKILFTSRLMIRPMGIKDTDIIVEWRNQDYIREVSLNNKIISSTEHKNWFKKSRDNRLDFIFFDKLSKEPIGVVSFDRSKKQSFFSDYFELSKYIGNKNYFGKGLAYEVCIALLDELNSNNKIMGIYAVTRSDNLANIGLNIKLGFKIFKGPISKITTKKDFVLMHKDFTH